MYYNSPVGILEIHAENGFINEINFLQNEVEQLSEINEDALDKNGQILKKCAEQLDEYFLGKRIEFNLPLQQHGTEFQLKVWNELLNIPFGETINYLTLAKRIGNLKSIRAVGTANGRNNISIVVPCHRVIGSDGSLTGYSGGLWRKQWLLEHENKYANGVNLLF
ncbi:MAG: methylated-DNA--[protein]-cysteine S-methyltransferase [Ginsengibacter sp.]